MSETIKGKDGKIIFYGLDQFINDIVLGECCFICGAAPESKEFNWEHIIPNWILRRFNLHKRRINLPNNTTIGYSEYMVPCCVECNSELGRQYEVPISVLFSKDYKEIIKELESPETKKLLFKWLCLLYFKTYLKDTYLRLHMDTRKGEGKIGDLHYWPELHHLHCIVRSHYTNARLLNNVYGSIYINKICNLPEQDRFDYIDTPDQRGILLQLGEVGIISILDDVKACDFFYLNCLEEIQEGITIFQLYEVFAHFNHIKKYLEEQPRFFSSVSVNDEYEISVSLPFNPALTDKSDWQSNHGIFLRTFVERVIGDVNDRDQVLEEIESGARGYLWDEDGCFKDYSTILSKK